MTHPEITYYDERGVPADGPERVEWQEWRAAIDAGDDARVRRAAHAILDVYAPPWGIKASEEDCLLGVLRAENPAQWERSGEAIYRLRADPELVALADQMCEWESESLPAEAVAARILDALDDIAAEPGR